MKKTMFLVMVMIIVSFLMFGCDEITRNEADNKQTEQTEKMMVELNNQIGLPNISNFQQKKLMKMVYELCDKENLICYAYLKSDLSGKLVYLGRCIGYGIPFSAQYTNPMKRITRFNDTGTIPQADPNGLYMPTSSSATWLMLIDEETNEPGVAYIEPEIVVLPFMLKL